MAFSFAKIKPVGFGDFEAIPKMTQEQKLRVSQLKISSQNLTEAQDILSQCFGEKSSDVKAFMQENFHDTDYARLQVYLLDGEKGLEDFNRRLDALSLERMKEAIND